MKKQTKIILTILLIGVLGAFFFGTRITGTSTGPVEHIVQVGAQEFLDSYAKTQGAILIDVRTPAEFSAGHIQGATNIDFENSNFISEVEKLDPAKTYFVYCRSGNRSGQAVALMKRAGILNIYDLRGGVASSPQIPLVQ